MVSESNSTGDDARRGEIVRRTLVGLEEDLDDLRDELGTSLEEYEGRINTHSGALPEWLDMEPAMLRSVFQLEDEAYGNAMLGPRAVAIGAARVEAFIHAWIGKSGAVRDDVNFDVSADEFDAARKTLNVFLDELESAARDTALDADASLSEWLDAILVDLDDQREHDAEALKQLVRAGDVGRGKDAREEIAQLWEEQRARVAELKGIWEPMERLVFEGVDITVEGISELRGLVRRAVEGLAGAHDELAAIEEDDDAIDDVSSDTIPGPMYAATDDEEEGPGHAIDDARRVTEPISTEGLHTSPYLRKPRRHKGKEPSVVEDGPTSAPAHETKASEVDEEHAVASQEAQPEAVDAQPERDPEPSADVEVEIDEPGPTEPMLELEEDVAATPTLPDSHDRPTSPSLSTADDGDDGDDGEVDELGEELPDVVRGEAFRVGSGWKKVPPSELAWGLGLPALFFAVLGYGALTRLTSMALIGGFDPFDAWPWAWPWGFIVMSTWLFLVAVVRHWRPMWRGWKIVVVQWRETRESMEVEVDEHGVRLDALLLRWDQLDADVSRWESKPDGTFGWMVELKSRRTRALKLVTAERNFTRWKASSLRFSEITPDVWQVNPVVIEKVRQQLD